MAGTRRSKIKKGDQVVVIAGKDYNKFVRKGAAKGAAATAERTPHRGRVLEVSPSKGKVKVEGAGIIKKHQRSNAQNNRGGGIIEREAWIDISNVQLIDAETGKPTRVKFQKNADGTKTRIAARSGNSLDK